MEAEIITEDQIIADILKYSSPPEIQPGDIDYRLIMGTAKCSYNVARRIADNMVDSGEYIRTQAYCPERQRVVVIFRRVNK